MQMELNTLKDKYQSKQSEIIRKLTVMEQKEFNVPDNSENLEWLKNTIGSLNAEVANLRLDNQNFVNKNHETFEEMKMKIDSLSVQNENLLRNSVQRLTPPKMEQVKSAKVPSFSPAPVVKNKEVHYHHVRFCNMRAYIKLGWIKSNVRRLPFEHLRFYDFTILRLYAGSRLKFNFTASILCNNFLNLSINYTQ